MKLNKLIFPMVLALTAVLASTGCKKGITKVTPLPGPPSIVSEGGGPGTIPNGNPINNNENPLGSANPNGGPIPTTIDWDPANTVQDRAALAAYTVHFKFDSAVVQDNEQSNISSVAAALTSDPSVKLLIEGNCDERGTEEYNRALGERRALALREALAKAGIDPARIRTISYGKDKPADPGHDESAFAKNRRGDFVLCHPKTGV
ncbi:MAG TPA: OmpA family protein [Candidatus Angelobacter sp.]|jgi:peptidoglycan-associated lipoprotein|nr:OmpA family protein [Candidatus Angelobacter sp.]